MLGSCFECARVRWAKKRSSDRVRGMTDEGGTGAVTYRADRDELLATPDLRGSELARALSSQADGWFEQAASTLPTGWSLLATGGYADGRLSPGSDIDVMLLHPRRQSELHVAEVSRQLWYPFWNAGLKLSPAVHSLDSALRLAATDLPTATTLLRARHLGGQLRPVERLAAEANQQWRKHPRRWLAELDVSVLERHVKAGEVAFLLEPNLKDGRGGIRDIQAIGWALAGADVASGLVCPVEELETHLRLFFDVRVELHRVTNRAADMLVLQEQDAVAERLGYTSADAMVACVAEAARSVAWASDRLWEDIRSTIIRSRRRAEKPVAVAADLVVRNGSLDLSSADSIDQTLILHVAAKAAELGVLPSLQTLRTLLSGPDEPLLLWTENARADLLRMLGSGAALIGVVEALDQHGLFRRVLPEWQAVRSRPQRNAYHTYTVDRHLLVTVVHAAGLVRTVSRPDLLLLGALLHDIGKCGRGDHTVVGMELTRGIGERMGLPERDVATLVCLVEHHLLLPETATRRDVHDPGTAEVVAKAVGDSTTLELLHALTKADSQATGPSAWSSWKSGLIDQLVQSTHDHLRGRVATGTADASHDRHAALISAAAATPGLHVQAEASTFVVAAADRRGLFAIITGVLAAHGIEVLDANVSTTDDGVAIDEFRITRSIGGLPDWQNVKDDLVAAMAGRLDIEARIDRRARTYRRAHLLASKSDVAEAAILIDNQTSVDATILEVRAPDGPALLFRLASVIARLGLDIRHAKVVTLGHEVVDVFYVRNGTPDESSKLSDDLCDELRVAISLALQTGTDEAESKTNR